MVINNEPVIRGYETSVWLSHLTVFSGRLSLLPLAGLEMNLMLNCDSLGGVAVIRLLLAAAWVQLSVYSRYWMTALCAAITLAHAISCHVQDCTQLIVRQAV